MPKTTKERQEDYRAKQALLGMQEVRGIFLPPDLHQALKNYAAKLLKRSTRKPAKASADTPKTQPEGEGPW